MKALSEHGVQCVCFQSSDRVGGLHEAAAAERERVRRRYGSSARHTMQVDFDAYLRTLDRELGRAR